MRARDYSLGTTFAAILDGLPAVRKLASKTGLTEVCPTGSTKPTQETVDELAERIETLPMTLRERLEWLGRMTLLVFILAAAAVLSAITAMRVAIHGRGVTRANLVGKNGFEARQRLQSSGLGQRM